MKSFRLLLILGLVAGLFYHCTQNRALVYETNFDFDIEADLTNLNRYDWLPLPVTAKIDTLNAKRFKAAVDSHLKTQGLIETSQQPDFLIETRIGSLKKMDTTGGPQSYGIYVEAQPQLFFLNPDSRQVLWWGQTRVRVNPGLAPEQKDALIAEAVAAILQNFPPPADR
ncbi:MAG: hypothetical protein AMJ54_11050 [Deltaproteobacteria bacterium SG8_13]|nr:MAG: hypothetical protein AMJ54_11050 [Deltaproteobacteria bacterium SG8_13]